ncbi:MAG: hypothetical protein AB9Q19_00435 [Candidatus Reddybacter sp.]
MRELVKIFEALAVAQVIKALAVIVLIMAVATVTVFTGLEVDFSIKLGGENELNTRAH